jgi:hypothetical protein
MTVELKDDRAKQGEAKWWKFAMSGRDGGFKKPSPKPLQMSLFDALQDLQDDDVEVKIRKKDIGRLQLGLEIGFRRVKF